VEPYTAMRSTFADAFEQTDDVIGNRTTVIQLPRFIARAEHLGNWLR
jgi:hypothetical protein